MKIISVVGARPQFVKLHPLCREINNRKHISHIIVHTGQHYDYEMSRVFFDELHIPRPDYNLDVGSYSHGKQTALMLERIEKALLKEKDADFVLVYGDTNSTLAGALAAAKIGMPVAHVESGLRSYRMDMPEEVNRVLTDCVSEILFCPTKNAVKNLGLEGKTKGVYLVGDLMQEIMHKYFSLIKTRKIIHKLGLEPKEYFLLTVHRQENADNHRNLRSILSAFTAAAKKVVFPVHPRIKEIVRKMRTDDPRIFNNFIFIEPVGYLDMLTLEKNALKIITDSGGVQREAHWLGAPCLTLRNETEWPETMGEGRNVLVGSSTGKICKMVSTAKVRPDQYRPASKGPKTAKRIIDILLKRKEEKC